jgi:hypothetical protein
VRRAKKHAEKILHAMSVPVMRSVQPRRSDS